LEKLQVIIQEIPAPHVCRITLNRPEAANALSQSLAGEIAQAFDNIGNCRVVLLTGAGEKAFCSGADLKERKNMDEAAWKRQHEALEVAVHAVEACPVPVVAVVNGAAYAGGLELALACDFMVAATTARFALTESSLGIMPGLGGTQNLPKATGERAAKEMLYTAKPIDAEKALALGLVNALYTPETLQTEALALAQAIAANAPLSLRAIKKAMREGNELAIYQTLINTKDRVEGNAAFLEKRKACFKGE
jgi:enoyl-CoA hydratase